jgi:hypothetical protein
MTDAYSSDFYKNIQHGSRISAEVILPPIFQAIRPRSMIDVGCGVGTWMTVAQRLGARCVGLEGDWIQNASLPALDIRVVDLEQPISLDKKFDLALGMEVGEHLSQPRSETFVRDLCGLSDCVLFSAAVPGQRGTGHINLQWQSWWAALFAHNGFVLFDCIRPRVWNNRPSKGGIVRMLFFTSENQKATEFCCNDILIYPSTLSIMRRQQPTPFRFDD